MIIDSPIISGSYLSTGSLSQTGNVSITGSLTATAGISGSFSGSGANLFGIPASGITGLNLSQISSGSVSASISPNQGLLINTSVSASNFSGSFTGSLVGIATSASFAYTASSAVNASASLTAITASFALTASYLTGYVSPFPFSGSAQITGSLAVTGSINATGNITTVGTITAQTLVVQTITSSIEYSSGSNIFGSQLTNTQTFTGSVNITGSAVNLKDGVFSGSGANLFGIPATGITGLNLSQISSGSVSASISPNFGLLINTSVSASSFTGSFSGSFSGAHTGSLFGTASFALDAATLTGTGSVGFTTTASFNAVSSSQQSISASLLQVSASYIALSASYNTFSGSASTRITTISSSQQDISASQQQISASLLTVSRSYASTGSNTFVGLETITGSLIVTGSVAISSLTTGSGVRYVIADQNGLISAQTASAAIFTTQQVVSTANQTTFPITNGYSTGYVTVFVNGTKLSADEYVDTSGTNIIFLTGSTAGDTVEFQKYLPAAGVSNNTLRSTNYFTATTGQTDFTVNYTPGLLDVFYNGAKLDNTEYTAANGTSITLATGSNAGDRLEVDVYSYQVGAFSGIGGTGAANQLAYFNTSNSITGSNAFTVSGSAIIITGSLIVSGSGTLINIGPAVFSGSVTAVGGFSGSFSGNADSASLAQNSLLLQGTGSIGFATTASFLAVSSSQQQISSSLLNVVANYATTGSNSFRANQSITGSLVVSSTITAQTLVVQTVTSSIVYSSGSNVFGNQLANTQTFTGSVNITGSQIVYGSIGIGTIPATNQAPLFHVYNSSLGTATRVRIESSASLAGALDFYNTGSAIWSIVVDSTQAYGKIENRGLSTDAIRFYNSTNNVILNPTTGNVGIGTTNPDSYGTYSVLQTGGTTLGIIQACDGTVKTAIVSNGSGFGIVGTRTNHDLRFYTNDIIKMILTSGGSVGIGTTSPSYKLDVRGTYDAAGTISVRSTDSAAIDKGGVLGFGGFHNGSSNESQFASIKGAKENANVNDNASYLSFGTQISGASITEKMRITSGGLVGIGTTTPTYNFQISTTSESVIGLVNTSNGVKIDMVGYGTGLTYPQARIQLTDAGFYGGILSFHTKDNGAAANSLVERLRITNAGSVGIGTTSPLGRLHVYQAAATNTYLETGTSGTSGKLIFKTSDNADVEKYIAQESYFMVLSGNSNEGFKFRDSSSTILMMVTGTTNAGGGKVLINTLAGSGNRTVYSDGSGYLTNSSSDVTLKKNVENITHGLDSIMSLRPVSFNWILEDLGPQREIGFIAQEVQEVIPEVIGVNSNNTLSLDYAKLTATLTKAIQEQNVLIQELQEKLQRNNIN